MTRFIVATALTLLATPALAQPDRDYRAMQAQRRALLQHGLPAQAPTDGRQRPRLQSAYDIELVEIEISPPRGGLMPEEGRITVRMNVNEDGIEALPLIAFFFEPLEIRYNGQPIDFMRDPASGELLVFFLRPVVAGLVTLTMDVAFDGYCQDDQGCIQRGEQQHLAQIGWYPLNAEVGPDDYFDVNLNIRIDDGRVAAGTGSRDAPQRDGNATLWRFSTTHETILPAFALGPNRIEPIDRIIEVYVPPRTVDEGQFIGRVTQQSLEIYASLLGPYPFTRLGVTPISDQAGVGLGPQANILLPESFWQVPEGSAEAEVVAQVTAHEVAHQYFFNLVHIIDNAEGWMSEAFAEYAATRVSQVREGNSDHARLNYWDYMLGVPPDQDAAVNSEEVNLRPGQIRQRLIYFKGSSVLHQLAARLDGFDGLLAAWVEQHAGEIVTTQDFIEFMSAASGTDIGPFMAQWIRWAGHPYLQVSVRHPRDGADTVDVQVVQFQDGRRFNAELPVVAHFEDGEVVPRALRIEAEGIQTLDVGQAQWLELDPQLTIFRRIIAEPQADVNLTGVVDGMDLLDTLANTGLTAPHPRWKDVLDVDRNLTIDGRDAAEVIETWGAGW